jgi:hypothetical protein
MPDSFAAKLALMLLAGGVLTGICWWRPLIGLAVYLASVGLDYLFAVAGFNTAGLVSLGQGMLVILVAVSLARWYLGRRDGSSAVRKLFWRIGGLVAMVWLSTLFGLWPAHSLFKALVFTATCLIPFMLWVLIDSERRLQGVVWGIGLGVALSALIGCLQYQGMLQTLNSEERSTADDARGAATEYRANGGGSVEGKRYAGPTNNPNGFGVVLMGGIPPLFYLVSSRRSWFQKTVAAAALGLCGFALLLTMSRTHILGFFAFLVLISLFNQQRNLIRVVSGWLVLLLVAAAFLLALYQIDGVRDRLLTGFNGDNSSDTRQGVMLGGLKAWMANPLLGIGLNNTELAGYNETGNASHDIVSTLLGELGGLGTLAFVLVVWQALKLLPPARVCSENGRDKLPGVGAFVKAALIVCLLTGVGDPVIDGRALWIWIGLAAVLHRLANTVAEAPLEQESFGHSLPEAPLAESLTRLSQA